MIHKPSKKEYPEYFEHYISLAPSDIMSALEVQLESSMAFYRSLTTNQLHYRYEENKWTVQEVLGHCIDVERVFAYRAMRYSRNDKTNLPNYDDDYFVQQSNYDQLEITHLLNEYYHLRTSTIQMFKNFSDIAWNYIGISSNKEMVTSAIPFIIFGHEAHHKNIINERYI